MNKTKRKTKLLQKWKVVENTIDSDSPPTEDASMASPLDHYFPLWQKETKRKSLEYRKHKDDTKINFSHVTPAVGQQNLLLSITQKDRWSSL